MKHLFIIISSFLIILCSSTAWGQTLRVYRSIGEVAHPDSVVQLSLRRQHLKSIPPDVFSYRNLQVLDLSRNRIRIIPDSISRLTELRDLNMERNKIHSVPSAIGSLCHLRRINLSRNPILDLPASMSQLSQLEELIIWSTGVIEFPDSFRSLNYTLKLIDMRACPLMHNHQEAIEEMLPTPRKRWNYTCNCK